MCKRSGVRVCRGLRFGGSDYVAVVWALRMYLCGIGGDAGCSASQVRRLRRSHTLQRPPLKLFQPLQLSIQLSEDIAHVACLFEKRHRAERSHAVAEGEGICARLIITVSN